MYFKTNIFFNCSYLSSFPMTYYSVTHLWYGMMCTVLFHRICLDMTVNHIDLWQAVAWNKLIIVATSSRCSMTMFLKLLSFCWIVPQQLIKLWNCNFMMIESKNPLWCLSDVCPHTDQRHQHKYVQINYQFKSQSFTV